MTQQLSRLELARRIYQIAYLRGNFKLRSGQTSQEYFDKYRFEANPELLSSIGDHLAPLIPKGTEVLAGLEMGGIPIATVLSLKTGIPVAFVRKKAKDYGTCQFAEGYSVQGKNVCIIEDVITTGGQVILSAADLRSLGAQISTVLCVIDRGGGAEKLKEVGLQMKPLFHMDELKSS
ncbi:MAG: orotate phosphoribosyltransferase [Oligoflexia bacterium]|nr:MAG: orotate phosphoribosyltransferase [Oligoflexia bacterium]